jgi:membrane protease YdiL (CAAX protease family)
MHSISAPDAMRSARRASDSKTAHFLARAGLIARGVIYMLIGWVAVLVALGHSSREADQQGALQMLAGKPYGLVSLWLLGVGFAGYALWRLSEAAYGVTGERPGPGPRLKSLGRAVVYAGWSYLTFTVISGTARSQSGRQQDITATAMQHPAGRALVGVVGLAIAAVGITVAVEGARKKFMKYLRTAQMNARTRRVVKRLGMTGTIARGLVFALAGVLVIDAAVTHKASESGGIDKALLTLRDQPFGEFLMMLAALGLVVFGVYGLCEARWRTILQRRRLSHGFGTVNDILPHSRGPGEAMIAKTFAIMKTFDTY